MITLNKKITLIRKDDSLIMFITTEHMWVVCNNGSHLDGIKQWMEPDINYLNEMYNSFINGGYVESTN